MSEVKKADLKSMNIAEDKLRQLKQTFPEAFGEGNNVDFDKLKIALGENVDVGRERFGMNWPGKADCFKTIQVPSLATLIPVKDESVNFETAENLFIEGDNLEVLKLLQKSYYGKVKMIYIDPPYNTGKDFIYPDNYSESLDTYLRYSGQIDDQGRKYSTNAETGGRFHSKWMSMMYPRLYLGRNLLTDDGIIFISIDDSEVNNLRKICDEIFGEENFVNSFTWEGTGKNDSRFVSAGHDYIIAYFKNKQFVIEKDVKWRLKKDGLDEIYKCSDGFVKAHFNNYRKASEDLKEWFAGLPKNHPSWKHRHYNSIDEGGVYFAGDISAESGRGRDPYDVIHPITRKPCKAPARGWPTRKFLDDLIQKNLVEWGSDETSVPKYKRYLKDTESYVMPSVIYKDRRAAFKELVSLFDAEVFDNPKDKDVIGDLIHATTEKSDIILDFFAGSATTAHSVFELNISEKTDRRFILVQLPEICDIDSQASKSGYKTIADVSKERIRRVINDLKKECDATKENVLFQGKEKFAQNLGFKVFKLVPSNFKIWDVGVGSSIAPIENQLQLHIDHINPQSSQEDILFELLLKAGFELTTKIEKIALAGKVVFSIEGGLMLICLENELTLDLVKAIAEKMPSRVICLDKGFNNNDQLKTNAVQIMKSKNVEDFRTI